MKKSPTIPMNKKERETTEKMRAKAKVKQTSRVRRAIRVAPRRIANPEPRKTIKRGIALRMARVVSPSRT
jgi:hypothetical protein